MSGKESLGKSLFSKAADLFAPEVPDEVAPDPALPPPAGVSAAAIPSYVPAPSVPAVDPAYAKQLDDAATAKLSAAMEKVAGAYAEFVINMEVLAEAVPDEGARIKAVMKLLTKKGVNPVKLLSDVDACLGALEEENRVFKTDTQGQIDQKVGSKRKTVEKLRADIASKQAQISALQTDIAALTDMQGSAASEIKDEEDNIAVVRDRFSYIFTTMRASLTSQRARLAAQGS